MSTTPEILGKAPPARPAALAEAPAHPWASAPNGEHLVAGMAAGRGWWLLRAVDVAPWIGGLPAIARTNRSNRLGWLGRPWDGMSDMPIGEAAWDGECNTNFAEPLVEDMDDWESTTFAGAELVRLLAELRRLLTGLPSIGVATPDHLDVRAALAGQEGDVSEPTTGMLVVDFDVGGMIVPLGIEDWQMRADTWTPVERVADLMVERLVVAAERRSKLLRRERHMREAFERLVAEVGAGAAPLWLRMEPLRFDSPVEYLFNMPYVALDVRLDIHQVWAPTGIERVASPAKLRSHYRGVAARHRRNAERLLAMREAGSLGWISDVALALIEQAGRNPSQVLLEERTAALNDDGRAHYGCDGHFGALFYHNGILYPFFTFEGGNYCDGRLTIQGTFPETLAVAAPGRRVAQYVDHPAFVATDATIERADWHSGRLDLFHVPRLFTAEEAERRWLDSRGETGAA